MATQSGLLVGQVVITTNEITAAAGEQSDGIGQSNVALTQLNQMTPQGAALVEQRSVAAEGLKDQPTDWRRSGSGGASFRIST